MRMRWLYSAIAALALRSEQVNPFTFAEPRHRLLSAPMKETD